MKIRHKLFLGFGLYTFLAVLGGFLSFKELRTITTHLALVELADDTTNTILEVRRFEKNFLLYKDTDSLLQLKKYLGILKKDTGNITAEIIKEIGTDNYTMMTHDIAEYESVVEGLAQNFKSQEGLTAGLRTSGREIERRLRGNDLRTFLVLRRYEKNLLLYKDQRTYETFMKTFSSLSPGAQAGQYRALAEKLFDLFKDERDSVEKMRIRAREIHSFTEELSKRERASINAILETSRNMLFLALLSIVAVGIVINVKLARTIATPIRHLEKVTKKVAMGDFSEMIEVTGKDEITSLEISFNQMEDRLKDTLSSLELAVKNLHEKQAQLVEAGKLASIGILSAGIAHEINNPLTSVLTFSHLMLEQTPADDPRRERLKMIVRETERARIIVRQLLSFAKETKLKKVKTNINCPLNEMIETLSAQGLFGGIDVSLDLSESLPEVSADPIKLEQVVLNILLNAIHSITPPGKIDITTRTEGDFVEIAISDTGCGIPEEDIGRIFDPFYTTKDATKGTGLGLAVSYGIIKKHGGNIEVKSTLGTGSTFIVRLPVNG